MTYFHFYDLIIEIIHFEYFTLLSQESLFQKSDEIDHYIIQKGLSKSYKSTCFKWTYELSGNDYGVALLSKSYLTVTGIII